MSYDAGNKPPDDLSSKLPDDLSQLGKAKPEKSGKEEADKKVGPTDNPSKMPSGQNVRPKEEEARLGLTRQRSFTMDAEAASPPSPSMQKIRIKLHRPPPVSITKAQKDKDLKDLLEFAKQIVPTSSPPSSSKGTPSTGESPPSTPLPILPRTPSATGIDLPPPPPLLSIFIPPESDSKLSFEPDPSLSPTEGKRIQDVLNAAQAPTTPKKAEPRQQVPPPSPEDQALSHGMAYIKQLKSSKALSPEATFNDIHSSLVTLKSLQENLNTLDKCISDRENQYLLVYGQDIEFTELRKELGVLNDKRMQLINALFEAFPNELNVRRIIPNITARIEKQIPDKLGKLHNEILEKSRAHLKELHNLYQLSSAGRLRDPYKALEEFVKISSNLTKLETEWKTNTQALRKELVAPYSETMQKMNKLSKEMIQLGEAIFELESTLPREIKALQDVIQSHFDTFTAVDKETGKPKYAVTEYAKLENLRQTITDLKDIKSKVETYKKVLSFCPTEKLNKLVETFNQYSSMLDQSLRAAQTNKVWLEVEEKLDKTSSTLLKEYQNRLAWCNETVPKAMKEAKTEKHFLHILGILKKEIEKMKPEDGQILATTKKRQELKKSDSEQPIPSVYDECQNKIHQLKKKVLTEMLTIKQKEFDEKLALERSSHKYQNNFEAVVKWCEKTTKEKLPGADLKQLKSLLADAEKVHICNIDKDAEAVLKKIQQDDNPTKNPNELPPTIYDNALKKCVALKAEIEKKIIELEQKNKQA